MERYIITLDEHGTLHVPDVSATAIWMNEPELMELFGVVALTLRAAIKAVYKSGILNPGEAERRVRQADGYGMDVLYGLPLVIALAFRLHTCGAKRLRERVIGKFTCHGGRNTARLFIFPVSPHWQWCGIDRIINSRTIKRRIMRGLSPVMRRFRTFLQVAGSFASVFANTGRVVHFSMRTRLLPPPTFFPCPSQVPIRNASR